MNSTTVSVKSIGRTCQIPEAWLVGATRDGISYATAVAHWIEQARLEAQFRKENQ